MQNAASFRPSPSNSSFPVRFPAPGLELPVAPDFDAKADLVISRLPKGAAFYGPKHIAPLLGLTPNGFCKHCRAFKKLASWKNSYRFYSDEPSHIELLRGVIKVVLTSGMKLPEDLRWQTPSAAITHRAPQKVC